MLRVMIWFRILLFQHTAARRRLLGKSVLEMLTVLFQHTAARRRLPPSIAHSRGKTSFNTQPRGGGCSIKLDTKVRV